MIVLSASRGGGAYFVVSVVDLWPPVHVAVLWPVVAAAPLMESVLISLSWAAAVQSDLVCLGGGPCVLLESGSSAPRLIVISRISFSAGDAIRTCSFAHKIAFALSGAHRLLPSTPMTRADPIQWPCD